MTIPNSFLELRSQGTDDEAQETPLHWYGVHVVYSPFRPSPGPEILRKLYVEDRREIQWLIDHFESSYQAVKRWLAEAGIPRRASGERQRRTLDQAVVRVMYEDANMTIAEIAASLKASTKLVARTLKLAITQTRSMGPRVGRGRGRNKDGYAGGHGYVKVFQPNHPNANSRGEVFEHRFVMANTIRSPLRRDEDVHHRDMNKANNDPTNLEILSRPEHTRMHNLARSTAKRLHEMTRDQIADLYLKMSSVQMAKAFGTSSATVQRILAKHGIPCRRGRRAASGS
jgi:hypothetical protein